VSDIHLTDALHGSSIPRAATFERFWTRIQASRGKRPARLVFVGDLFDLVRSPTWLDGAFRPYHEPGAEIAEIVLNVVERILEREADFFAAIRSRVESGALSVTYLLGNHDRLLGFAPAARRRIWHALTGRDEDVEFEREIEFREHGVLAYHGHHSDPINMSPEHQATIGDAIGLELITRFPRMVKRLLPETTTHAELLDDIDDVRPVYAVPAWVRQLGIVDRQLLKPAGKTWTALVEDFLSRPFVRRWMRQRRGVEQKRFGFDTGQKLRLLLELSTKRVVAKGSDQRLTKVYKVLQHGFDGKMANYGIDELRSRKRLRYVVNGHSHFASMVPLGTVDGNAAVYFNTGTWRTVHQIGNLAGGRPSFLPYDAMSYLVFFPTGDPLGRDYEWWTGAMVSTAVTQNE
ncbi:MAG: hypothetical protein AAGE52_39775, partial [Myxococcota bacterium]